MPVSSRRASIFVCVLGEVSALVLLLQEEKGLTLKPSSLLSPARHFPSYSSALYGFK